MWGAIVMDMGTQGQTGETQRGAEASVPPELRPVAARYAALPTPRPGAEGTVRLLHRLIAERPRGAGAAPSWWRVTRQRLGDLRRGRRRRWWVAWLLINLLGTDISYGIRLSDAQLLREWQQG